MGVQVSQAIRAWLRKDFPAVSDLTDDLGTANAVSEAIRRGYAVGLYADGDPEDREVAACGHVLTRRGWEELPYAVAVWATVGAYYLAGAQVRSGYKKPGAGIVVVVAWPDEVRAVRVI